MTAIAYLQRVTRKNRIAKVKPWITQCFGTACLMGCSDAVVQLAVIRHRKDGSPAPYSFQRTLRFGLLGCLYVAPVCRVWYGVLERKLPLRTNFTAGQTAWTVFKRVFADQILFAPVSMVAFLFLNGVSQGYHSGDVRSHIKKKFLQLYRANLTVWPAVQMVNFWLVPLKHRLIFAQFVALFWNIFMNFVIHKH